MNPPTDTTTLEALRLLEISDARRMYITTPALRVSFLNTLRGIVARRFRVVSDYDLLDAESEEHAEALRRTVGWEVGL